MWVLSAETQMPTAGTNEIILLPPQFLFQRRIPRISQPLEDFHNVFVAVQINVPVARLPQHAPAQHDPLAIVPVQITHEAPLELGGDVFAHLQRQDPFRPGHVQEGRRQIGVLYEAAGVVLDVPGAVVPVVQQIRKTLFEVMSVLADARAEVRQARDVLGAKEDCQRVCHAFGREDVPVRYRDVPSVVEGHRPPDGVVLPPMSQAPPSGAQHRIALALALLGLIANLYCLDVLRFQFVRHLQRRRGGQYGSGAGIDVLQY
eukprot:CAMPEP_0183764198 /NCGR_PEP_ID=MMETSP0739-20130205/10167_1 /TAXON_ID=385413 /ORGANISM="Thalassiosira miniscula, Strain CCMP1093" /LENGTH=259 /DNA_ID=CAMNT_0026002705 /DNA_START=332 /DNA_END=1109 /DNA_ORIENTATION=-